MPPAAPWSPPAPGAAGPLGDAALQPMEELPAPRHGALRAVLLALWALASFGVCYFARDLQFTAAGWPFGYWMAAQGILLVFIALVTVYAVVLNRAERRDAPAAAAAAVGAGSAPGTSAGA